MSIRSSAPRGQRAWRVVVANPSISAMKVRAFAICQKGGTYEYLASTPVSAPAGGRTNTADLLCSDGFRVVGGGVDIAGSGMGVDLAQSGPVDDTDDGATRDNGWSGGATVLGSDAQMLQVFAICESTNTYSYVEMSLPADASGSQAVVNSCPEGSLAVGGGVTVDGSMNSFVWETTPARPSPDQPVGVTWFNNVGMGPTSSTKHSSVICRSLG